MSTVKTWNKPDYSDVELTDHQVSSVVKVLDEWLADPKNSAERAILWMHVKHAADALRQVP